MMILLVALFSLDKVFVGGVNEVVVELVTPDVDEMDGVYGQHGNADDDDCQGVVEESGVEVHEWIEDGISSSKIAIGAPLVDCSFEPIVVSVNRKDIAKSQAEEGQLGTHINNISDDGVDEMIRKISLFVANRIDSTIDNSSQGKNGNL